MKQKPVVAIVHYSCPPVIGGVESVIGSHARLLSANGYSVKIITGKGEQFIPGVELVKIPEIRTDHKPYMRSFKKVEDDASELKNYTQSLENKLLNSLSNVDVCIVHNVMTMHFNLALAWALKHIADNGDGPSFINWIHDCSLNDPTYRDNCPRDRYPWSVLGMKQKMKYVAISELREQEVSELFNIHPRYISTIPNGIDLSDFLGLTDVVHNIFDSERLAEFDVTALTPTRIVKRKNLELGLAVLQEMKKTGVSAKWLVTGAPDPHNPAVIQYFNYLQSEIRKRRLDKNVTFLSHKYNISLSSADVSSLYRVSNVLFFLSRQEGFGIPLIEAGLARLLVLASDIPPLRAVGGKNAIYVDPDGKKVQSSVKRLLKKIDDNLVLRMNRQVTREYPWELIFRKKIEPLIQKAVR